MTTENAREFVRNAAEISEEQDLLIYGNSFTVAGGQRVDPREVIMTNPVAEGGKLCLLWHRVDGSEILFRPWEFHHRQDLVRCVALTPHEKHILSLTADLWNNYVKLPKQHPSDLPEFQGFIHQIQSLIALRVARRVNPDVWK